MTPTTSPSRRRMLLSMSIAATLAFSLAACGSEDDGTADPTDTIASVDGSVPDAGGSDTDTTVPGMRPATPVKVASGSTGSSTPLAGREMANAETAADTSMLAPYFISEFLLGEGFPALPTNDVGFVFDAMATPTDEEIAAVAAVFGVEGDVVFSDQNGFKSWQVGPSDGSAPTLFVSGDAQLSWSFSPAWNESVDTAVSCVLVDPATSSPEATAGSEATEPVVGDALESTTVPSIMPVEECDAPAPPANIPTADEAEAMAIDLLTALGADTSTLTFDTYADEWSASVNAMASLDGVSTGKMYSFGYGADGELQWAGGSMATPSPVGPYALIDIDTALSRLVEMNAWQDMGYPTVGVAVDTAEAPVADVGVASEGSAGSTEPGVAPTDPMIDPMPVDPNLIPETYPAPEARTVTLVDVEADMWWVWDVDNVLWLLPAYRFIDSEGGWHVVPAVTDEFLIDVEPPAIEPAPMPEGTVVPAPEPYPVEPVDPTAPTTAPVSPDIASLEQALGLPLGEFTEVAETSGFEVRVTERDGESLPVTMDYLANRVNVAVVTTDGVEVVESINGLG